MAVQTSRRPSVSRPSATFFDDLARRGDEPMLRKVTGRVRFDVVEGRRTRVWVVDVDRGTLTVAGEAGPADCTIRGDGAVIDEIVEGRANAMAAVLRGALTCEGDLQLLAAIQRIFPGPPRGWVPNVDEGSAS